MYIWHESACIYKNHFFIEFEDSNLQIFFQALALFLYIRLILTEKFSDKVNGFSIMINNAFLYKGRDFEHCVYYDQQMDDV